MSIIKLTDGTRCYIQAVIDNFSRYVLAWHISKSYGGLSTKNLILKAIDNSKKLGLNVVPQIYVDNGSENINSDVDEVISEGFITRIIARLEVEFSNSMIEALFYRLKHKHLFFVNLKTFEILEEQSNFYLNEANNKIPLKVLNSATPFEVISGTWTNQSTLDLFEQSRSSRQTRIEINRKSECSTCS